MLADVFDIEQDRGIVEGKTPAAGAMGMLAFGALVLMVVAALGLGYLFWDQAVDAVNATLEGWSLVTSLFTWLERFELAGLKSALAPLIITITSGYCMICIGHTRVIMRGMPGGHVVLRVEEGREPDRPTLERALGALRTVKASGAEERKKLLPYRGGAMFELGCHLIDAVVALAARPPARRLGHRGRS